MPWGNMQITGFSNIWLGLIVGFGIVAVIMLVGFYMLLKSLEEVKMSVNKTENKMESVDEKVDKILKELEEI
ncbi:MAG: hypothetical protein J7K36_04240 [Archaeoglobaceae archaeon]|nr:hypothetical protein [Archaeoglobaceae archaeon]